MKWLLICFNNILFTSDCMKSLHFFVVIHYCCHVYIYINNRFLFSVNVDQAEIPAKKLKQDIERPKKKEEKATDDYHYEKFKKQFRR